MLNATESDRYLELLQQFPPRPIKSEEEFLSVQNVIDKLLDAEKMTLEQRDYLNVLRASSSGGRTICMGSSVGLRLNILAGCRQTWKYSLIVLERSPLPPSVLG
jgi:hypothetical protein